MWEWNSRKCGKDPWDHYLDLKKKVYTCVKVEVFIKSHSTLPLSMYIFIQSFRFMKICWLLHRILHQCIYVFEC